MEGDVMQVGGKRSREDAGSEVCCQAADSEAEISSKRARKEQEVEIPARPEDLISGMPDLIQDMIFGFLHLKYKLGAAHVCSSWKEAVYRPCQWKEVKVRLDCNGLSEERLSSIYDRKIRHVVLRNFLEESQVVKILQDWSGLESLDMSNFDLPFHVLQRVFCRNFPSLRKLDVKVKCTESSVVPKFDEVFQHLSNLEDLGIVVDDLSDMGEAIKRNLMGLKGLALEDSKDTSGSGFCLTLLSQLQSLERLTLSGLTLSETDCLNSTFKTLKSLTLEFCDLDSTRWPEILSQMSSLEKLELSYCYPETEDGLRHLGQGLKNLKVLSCGSFCGFQLHDNDDLRPFGPISSLQDLSLCDYDIEDGLMRALSCGLKNLRSLRIERANGFTPECMKYIAEMSFLQNLSLGHLDVDGRALKVISEGSVQLRELTLTHCAKIKGEDMKHVAKMSSLEDLILVGLDLGSTGMNYLSEGDLRLEALVVRECGLNLQGLKLLLEKQKSLWFLRTQGCVKTSEDENEVKILRETHSFPQCCILK